MARPHDNWVTLVTSVLKKVKFLELCRAESRSPSICSEASDLSSIVTLHSPIDTLNSINLDSSLNNLESDDDLSSSTLEELMNSPTWPDIQSSSSSNCSEVSDLNAILCSPLSNLTFDHHSSSSEPDNQFEDSSSSFVSHFETSYPNNSVVNFSSPFKNNSVNFSSPFKNVAAFDNYSTSSESYDQFAESQAFKSDFYTAKTVRESKVLPDFYVHGHSRGNVDTTTWIHESAEYEPIKKPDLPALQRRRGLIGARNKNANVKANDNKVNHKKAEEVAVSTVVMKIKQHCDGYMHKIMRIILKNIDGVIKSVKINLEEDLIIVTGNMTVEELTAYLRVKLKRNMETVPPKPYEYGTYQTAVGLRKEKSRDKKERKNIETVSRKQHERDDRYEKMVEGLKKDKSRHKKVKKVISGGNEGRKINEGSKVEVRKMEYQTCKPETHYVVPMSRSIYNVEYYAPMHSSKHCQQNYPHASTSFNPQTNNHISNPGYYEYPLFNNQQHQSYAYPNTGYTVQHNELLPHLGIDDTIFSDENPNSCYVM